MTQKRPLAPPFKIPQEVLDRWNGKRNVRNRDYIDSKQAPIYFDDLESSWYYLTN